MLRVPIVVVAFNRARSLQRLLNSLANAVYESDDIPLIISIDKGDNNEVLEVAEDFKWEFGEKKVIYQAENLKLRKHVLKCGDFAIEYGGVILLEDDLFVSKYFYRYALEALAFSKNDSRIGGISLYNHRFNVEAFEPFECHDDNYDNWYFQFASSWGEAWTKEQWLGFKRWYEKKPIIDNRTDVPDYVRSWADSSWLKYFIAYLIDRRKYFIYPKKSLTTNFSDAGTHVQKDNPVFQVPLQDSDIHYRFSTLEESNSVYDAFFENVKLQELLLKRGMDVTIDLYGKKDIGKIETDYLLSRHAIDKKVVKSYGCCMRPHEDNIVYDISGNDFFLYDMKVADKKPREDRVRKAHYNLRNIEKSQYAAVLGLLIIKAVDAVKRRIRKLG